LLQIAFAGLLFMIVIEGMARIGRSWQAAEQTTPYADVAAQLDELVPPGARVLGMPQYWFALQDTAYRIWALPIFLADPAAGGWMSFSDALTAVDPQFVLIDPRIRSYFESRTPGDNRTEIFEIWLAAAKPMPLATIEDPTYGPIEVIRLDQVTP
jgi:hypothetical protein